MGFELRGRTAAVGLAAVTAVAAGGLFAGSLSTTAPGELGAGAVSLEASCTSQVDITPGLSSWNSSLQAFTFNTVVVSGTLTNCASNNASLNIHNTSNGAVTSTTAEAHEVSSAEASAGEFTLTLDTAVDAGVDETTRSYAILLESTGGGVTYAIGDTGPGGGTVFYDAGSVQAWGQYLEAAPVDWNGVSDPLLQWGEDSGGTDCRNEYVTDLNVSIGTGEANTTKITVACDTVPNAPAAWATQNYTNNGESDWFLPSTDELNQLCKYARLQDTSSVNQATVCDDSAGPLRGGFEVGYWTSVETSATQSWFQMFDDFGGYTAGAQSGTHKSDELWVRPIRSF